MTIERLRELERAAVGVTGIEFRRRLVYEAVVMKSLTAMLAVIEAAEKAEKFIGSLKRWECSTGLESDAFPLHQELNTAIAAFREVRE